MPTKKCLEKQKKNPHTSSLALLRTTRAQNLGENREKTLLELELLEVFVFKTKDMVFGKEQAFLKNHSPVFLRAEPV